LLWAIKISGLAALGRWDEAETLMDQAGRDLAAFTARMTVQSFVEVLVRQGRIAEAAAAVRATDLGYATPVLGSFILGTRIRVANAEGRWDDARAAADEAIGLLKDPLHDQGVTAILELCVGGEADRAELARARRRTAEEAEARRVGLARLALGRRAAQEAISLGGAGPLIEAVLATAEAEGSRLKGRSDAEMWEGAARRREALGQPWETAYARFRQAEAVLGTRGRKQEALPLLREAHRIASQLGAPPLVEQIERLARRGRIRLLPAPAKRQAHQATTPEGVVVALTTREWEVLALVAAGHTNREIGEELFISNKTASVHITNVMNKLGALSRYDAAAIATRLGLLDTTPGGSAAR
jgi:ATP/maltotriose-dependent transcriptional regulator MalT